jgi:hypothetical protein
MLGEHLPERFREVFIRIFRRTANPDPIKLPTPMPSYPFAIGPGVHRPEYWAVFGDVDRPEPLSFLW